MIQCYGIQDIHNNKNQNGHNTNGLKYFHLKYTRRYILVFIMGKGNSFLSIAYYFLGFTKVISFIRCPAWAYLSMTHKIYLASTIILRQMSAS